MFTLSLLVLFLSFNAVTEVRPEQRARGLSAPGRAQAPDGPAQDSPPVKSERLFFRVVFSSQLINLRHGITGRQPSDDGRAGEELLWKQEAASSPLDS